MKIILYKDVLNLGEEGDIKVVADGYARNYLIPQKMAVRYSLSTQNELLQKQKAINLRKEEKAKAAADAKVRVESLRMEVALAAGKEGRLFGSITTHAVSDYLRSQGIPVERKRIELPEGGIKAVGEYSAKVKLYGGEDSSLKIIVSALGEEVSKTDEQEETKESAAEPPQAAAPSQDDDDSSDAPPASASEEDSPIGENQDGS